MPEIKSHPEEVIRRQDTMRYANIRALKNFYHTSPEQKTNGSTHWRRSRQKVDGDFLSTSTSTPVWTRLDLTKK